MVDVLLYVLAGWCVLSAITGFATLAAASSSAAEGAGERQLARHQAVALYLIAAILALGFASNG